MSVIFISGSTLGKAASPGTSLGKEASYFSSIIFHLTLTDIQSTTVSSKHYILVYQNVSLVLSWRLNTLITFKFINLLLQFPFQMVSKIDWGDGVVVQHPSRYQILCCFIVFSVVHTQTFDVKLLKVNQIVYIWFDVLHTDEKSC